MINYLPAEQPDADDVADLLAKEGIRITLIPGDLLSEEFCSQLVLRAERAMGGIDILVNNAGVSIMMQTTPRLIDTGHARSHW